MIEVEQTSQSACRLPLLCGLPSAVDLDFILFTIHLGLGWSEMGIHDIFDSPPDVSLGFCEFLQSEVLLMNFELDLCRAKPLPPRNIHIDQP